MSKHWLSMETPAGSSSFCAKTRSFLNHLQRTSISNKQPRRKHLMPTARPYVSCANHSEKQVEPLPILNLTDARVIYSVAPAMGHNQEAHPESHFRVPAIVSALDKMELTPKWIRLQMFIVKNKIDEVGVGAGEGTTLNLPLPGGSGDTAMRTVFDEVIAPCAERFKPDIILVSAGYDGHVLDPLASLQYTTSTYYSIASNIKRRCVFLLEGGYNLESLSYSVADTFRALLGDKSMASEFDNPAILYEEPSSKVKQAIERVKHLHSL
ncbi:Histone deacetylase 14, chloroplastic [Linum grandiflorum]